MGRRGHYEQETASDGEQRQCARAEWCSDPRIIRGDKGAITYLPALTTRVFCETDRSYFIRCLDEFPPAYERLGVALGEAPKAGASGIRVPFGPSEPVRGEVDALMRVTAAILCGWEARVRRVARQLPRDPLRDPFSLTSVTDAAGTLARQADALLALQQGWMTRVFTFPAGRERPHTALSGTCRRCGRAISLSLASGTWWAADRLGSPAVPCMHEPAGDARPRGRPAIPADLAAEIGGEEIVRVGEGWVKVTIRRGGTDAAREILDLHYRARRILGETRSAPESFDGIPCRNCEDMALERAEPPSDPRLPAMHSRCATCGHTMDRKTFAEWAAWYAGWAAKLELSCRRCQAKRCAECAWDKCSCAAAGHAA